MNENAIQIKFSRTIRQNMLHKPEIDLADKSLYYEKDEVFQKKIKEKKSYLCKLA